MKWTTGSPTVAGWYWARDNGLFLVRVYHEMSGEFTVQYHGTDHVDNMSTLKGVQWCGPIPPPPA